MNNTIRNIATNPRSAALVGFIIALPFPLLLLIAGYEIEPVHGFLKRLFTESDGVRMNTFSIIVFVSCLSLLPVALIINLAPVVRSIRAGNSVLANPVNLLLVITLLAFITTIVGVFVVDQYPCWVGVPNCD